MQVFPQDIPVPHVREVFKFVILLMVFQVLRRVFQACLFWSQTSQSEPLKELIVENLELKRGKLTVIFSIAALVTIVIVSPKPKDLDHVSPNVTAIAFFLVIAFAVLALNYKWHMHSIEKREAIKESKDDIGPGLAVGFYSYLENALADSRTSATFENYMQTQYPSGQAVLGCNVPLILFPDLTSDYYRGHIAKEEISLVSGIVRVECEDRRENRDHQIISVAGEAKYKYLDKVGLTRFSHYVSVLLQMPRQSGGEVPVYFFVADNRPLFTIQKWFLDSGKTNLDELHDQVSSFRRHLTDLLETNKALKNKCKILSIKGRLSEELKFLPNMDQLHIT